MQVCDFCGTTERQVPVRRLKLELRDPDPKSSPAWAKTTWWQLDLCREHWESLVQQLDALASPAGFPPTIKKPSDFAFKRLEEEIKVKTPKK